VDITGVGIGMDGNDMLIEEVAFVDEETIFVDVNVNVEIVDAHCLRTAYNNSPP